MHIKYYILFLLTIITTTIYAVDMTHLDQKWSDTLITTKIKTQFTKDLQLNPVNISVKTKHGVVYLKGHAKNKVAFVRALQVVANTKNVKAVDTSQFDIMAVNSGLIDAYITAKTEAAILEAKVFDDESIPLVGIKASTNNGVVSLCGSVKNEHAITAILHRVHYVKGIKKIKSHITVNNTITMGHTT